MGTELPWRWGRGTISANLDVIWGMSVEWRTPHSWLHVMVKDENGIERRWTLESNSIGQLIQNGWSPDIVHPGDPVTVVLNPLRDGTRGGRLEEIQHADGRVFTRIGIGGYDVRTGEIYIRP